MDILAREIIKHSSDCRRLPGANLLISVQVGVFAFTSSLCGVNRTRAVVNGILNTQYRNKNKYISTQHNHHELEYVVMHLDSSKLSNVSYLFNVKQHKTKKHN
jgi:hypothetical protein